MCHQNIKLQILIFILVTFLGSRSTSEPFTTNLTSRPTGQPPKIILAGGKTSNEGRVELYHNGSFGNICSFGWDNKECAVVCRSLNYRYCYNYNRFIKFGEGNGSLVTDNVDCTGYEDSLSDCANGYQTGIITEECYERGRIASAQCSNTVLDIRLVNGKHPYEGRVEVLAESSWGAVCDTNWDMNNGMVACRQAGYASVVEVYTGSVFGSDNSLIHLNKLKCLGTEAALVDCLQNGVSRVAGCNENTTAGVLCSDVLLDVPSDVIDLVDDIAAEQYSELEELSDGESQYFTMGDDAEGVILKTSSSTTELIPISTDPNGIAFSLEASKDANSNETFGIIAARLVSVNVSIPFAIDMTASRIASDLVSVTVYGKNGRNDTRSANVRIVYPSIEISEDTFEEPVCAFIDEAASPISWSRKGCETIMDATSVITCQCEHLTSFAILMQTETADSLYDVVEDDITTIGLDVMTYVGLIVSNLFLVLTISIICTLRDLRKSRRYKMLRHLSISLLCSNICFSLLSFDTENKIACSFKAACLHYCLLVAFCWMMILSTDMYMCIQHAFVDPEKRFLLFQIFGWAFPLLYVFVVVSVTQENYASDRCWLNVNNGVTWTFVGPVLFTILVVSFQVSIVGYIAYTKSQAIQQNDDEKNKLTQIKTLLYRILLLTPAVGLTWIFGIFTLFHNSIVLKYLFVLSSSLQGFFIWLTQCFLSNEVNIAWKKFKIQHTSNSIAPSIETTDYC